MPILCPKCATENRDGAKFCKGCGSKLEAVAPAPGRVVFAWPYRGYGSIVIIEHSGGWTSLITGLAQLDARVGDQLVLGSPLGITGAGRPVITLELRRNGEPVNPLEYIKAL